MKPYLYILRPKNLVIIGVTQVIQYYCIILPNINVPALNSTLFYLLVLDTMLLAASGFVINDIFDYSYDLVNKPKRTYIPNNISANTAKIYYLFLVIAGLLVAIYIAIMIKNIALISIYPIAAAMLFVYSYTFKNSILLGNVLVSLFVGLVSGIVIFAERNSVQAMTDVGKKQFVIEVFCFYMTFSFFVNMLREIIKDIEDIDGDKSAGILTFPIKYGISKTKKICIFIIVMLNLMLIIWMKFTSIHMDIRISSFLIIFIAAPLVVLIQLLTKSRHKEDYSKISIILKWIMVAGLISLMIIHSGK
ncbi:MAG: geranylgeranylglycerol-phosphate geranylgeranyltransferase [Saprospiraceae bacterium]|nr:geranylgeranylglycerol-phosphate geranylgeranyltransferase [Saprospiraceae bacterium]